MSARRAARPVCRRRRTNIDDLPAVAGHPVGQCNLYPITRLGPGSDFSSMSAADGLPLSRSEDGRERLGDSSLAAPPCTISKLAFAALLNAASRGLLRVFESPRAWRKLLGRRRQEFLDHSAGMASLTVLAVDPTSHSTRGPFFASSAFNSRCNGAG